MFTTHPVHTAPKLSSDALHNRVVGWDLLRGLCALSVAFYHMLSWLNIAHLYPLGLYGVYIFFVLSGASLTFTYGPKMKNGNFSFFYFLLARYFRLAPLYFILLFFLIPWKLKNEGFDVFFLGKLLSNILFSFGIYKPVGQAMLVGGWSLGIEFLLYLLFPVFLMVIKFHRLTLCAFATLLVLKITWIGKTLGADLVPTASEVVAYHHLPAFAVYFLGGCILGEIIKTDQASIKKGGVSQLLVQFFAFFLMAQVGESMTDALTGWNGVVLTLLCFVLVAYSGSYNFSGLPATIARSFGDATYGLYLIHPVIYFGFVFVVFPYFGIDNPADFWSIELQLSFAVCVVCGAYISALAIEKYFERPIRLYAWNYIKQRHFVKEA